MRTSVPRRFVALTALVLGFLVLGAAPASAHSVGGSGATNFVTTIGALKPAVPGLSLAVVENGMKLQIENRSGVDVVVDGYVGDQYLKVGPGGTFVNTNSPATYLNADRWAKSPVPAGVDPNAAPVWRKVSDSPVFRWHDHRIHWMSTSLPPAVKAAPGKPHQISTFTITLHRDGQTITADGTLEWRPGPSKAVWLGGLALAFAVALAACVWSRAAVVAVAMVAADVWHSLGIMDLSVGTFLKGNAVQLVAWAAALWAAYLLLRRKSAGAVWLGAGAGLLTAAASGIPDLSVLWSSTAPFTLGMTTARLLIAIVTGLGLALAAALPVYLLRTQDAAASELAAPLTAEPEAAPLTAEPEAARLSAEPEPARLSAEPEAAPLTAEPANQPALAHAETEAVPSILPGPSRRSFLTTSATSVGGVAAGAAASALLLDDRREPAAPVGPLLAGVGTATVAAPLPHQAGISVPARQQAHGTVAAFDLTDGATNAQLKALLKAWTAAIADLTAGRPAGADDMIAADTGPSSLTVTVGFGPSLFGKAGLDAASRPSQLAPLPKFGDERLDPARCDGDLGVVIAADDKLVVFHALRTLTRLAAATATPRWSMSGFTRAPGAAPDDSATGRNLMGQFDGTNNPVPSQPDFERKVFVASDADPAWMRGGSYLVVRRIRMLLEDWDAIDRTAQEKVIGRRKDNGAPLHGGSEHTPVNLAAQNPDGSLAIRGDAHIRLASPATNGGAAMLRRGLSYDDGLAPDGKPDAGLLFLAWQADPKRGFVPVQDRLTHGMDALNKFIRHETSALFAMVPAPAPGGYLGQALLEPGVASAVSAVTAVTLPPTIGDGGTERAVTGPDGIQRITVTADDNLRYHPSIIEMSPGTIEITFKNVGTLPHTLTEDGPSVPQLAGGAQTTMSLKLTQPGDYPFQCGYHAAEGMYGVIRVR